MTINRINDKESFERSVRLLYRCRIIFNGDSPWTNIATVKIDFYTLVIDSMHLHIGRAPIQVL